MPWSCEQTELRVTEILERNLEPAEQADWETHRRHCPHCGELVAAVAHAVEAVRGLPPEPIPPTLIPRILEQTLGSHRWARRRASWWPRWQPRLVLATASVLITCLLLLHTFLTPSGASLADISPVRLYRTLDRRAHLIYARSVRVLTDLRLIYELQSRLGTLTETQPQPETTPATPRHAPDASPIPQTQLLARPRTGTWSQI